MRDQKLDDYLESLPRYLEGMVLADNEYLLKVRKNDITGFLSKLTKKGIPPKPFTDWNNRAYTYQRSQINNDVYIFTEDFSTGWYYNGFRGGMSQDWCEVKHPKGFILEIYYLGSAGFDSIIKTYDVIKGEIIGSFKWEDKKLIEK